VTRAERFLDHLDELSGGVEPRFFPVDSSTDLPPVVAITYEDLPEPGMLTAITYGLSLADHPEWRLGKPELCITVNSRDDVWAHAVGHIAERGRGNVVFKYGDVINFGTQVSPESEMTSFVVFAPAVLDKEDCLGIDVGDDLPINISGIYPIHAREGELIVNEGLEAFWKRDWDLYDVSRPSVA
jgi:hypothetical protein